MEDTPKKRAPGRPKKNKDLTPSKLRGIITEPDNPDSRVEMMISHCAQFAKVIGLVKDYGGAEIDFIFDASQCIITAPDHKQKVDIFASIPASHMAAYYCSAPTRIRISQKNLQIIFASINKNHTSITIICKADYMSAIYILLTESLHESITQLKIGVGEVPAESAKYPESTEDYPLSFNIHSSSFKPLITSFRDAKSLCMTKDDGYICMQPERAKERIDSDTSISFPINSSLSLRTTLAPDEFLSVSFEMDHIYRFASKLIGDTVNISADKSRRIVFSTETPEKDGKIQIRVYVSLLTYN